MINVETYMHNTLANWREISAAEFAQLRELGQHHYTSDSGSQYFEHNGHIYRQSDHWGAMIAGCAWFIDGRTLSRKVCGVCALSDFQEITLDAAQQLPLSKNSWRAFEWFWGLGRYEVSPTSL